MTAGWHLGRLASIAFLLATACAGETDPVSPPDPEPAPAREGTLLVFPGTAEVGLGESFVFRAYVTGPSDPGTVWQIREGGAGGWINQGGIYSAPMTAGEYHLDVHSTAFTEMTTTVTVKVRPRLAWPRVVNPTPGESVVIEPLLRDVARVLQPVPDPVFRVLEGDAGGTITPDGVYTAPARQGSYRIEVRSRSGVIFPAVITASVPAQPVWIADFEFPDGGAILGAAALPDDSTILYGGNGVVSLWGWDGKPVEGKTVRISPGMVFQEHLDIPDATVLAAGSYLTAVDHSGSILWTRHFSAPIASLAEAGPDRILFLSSTGYGTQADFGELDRQGQIVWKRRTNWSARRAVKAGERIIVAGIGGNDSIQVSTFTADGLPVATFAYHLPEAGYLVIRQAGRRLFAAQGSGPLGITSLSSNGEIAWRTQILARGRFARGSITGLAETPEGDLVAGGVLHERLAGRDYPRRWIAKLSSDGDVIWAREIRGLRSALQTLSIAVSPRGLIDFVYYGYALANTMGRIPPDGWIAIREDAEFEILPLDLSTRPLAWEKTELAPFQVVESSFSPVTYDTYTVTPTSMNYARLAP